ncbi:MAG: tyrosine-type recombinase/integrase, partial [Synechococcales bacterium]|nr:tyrosine-type recombinase/integrase [Synechococcales bacterium]
LSLPPMSFQNIPEPQILRLLPNSQPIAPPEPADLRQQRVDEFLAARSLAPKSQKAYREDLARFMTWTDTAWSQVTPRQVAQFKTDLLRLNPDNGKRVLSDASVKRILQTLKNFYNWMQLSGYLDRNPTYGISLPKLPEPEANHLTDSQVKAIFQAASDSTLCERNLALLSVLLHGLRAQEAANLNVGDFDGQRVKIRQAKADSKGTVPLDLEAQMWVNHYLQWRAAQGEMLTEESPLFTSHSNRNQGQRMGYHAIQKLMKAIAAKVGFDFHAHQFRHTFATNLILNGMNPYHAMTLTRHKSPQTFRRYTLAADELAAEQAFRSLNSQVER